MRPGKPIGNPVVFPDRIDNRFTREVSAVGTTNAGYPRLRIDPVVSSCACGCGRKFTQVVSGAKRKFWGKHHQHGARARYLRKKRGETPRAITEYILAELGQ
jgi:hypothetical protein